MRTVYVTCNTARWVRQQQMPTGDKVAARHASRHFLLCASARACEQPGPATPGSTARVCTLHSCIALCCAQCHSEDSPTFLSATIRRQRGTIFRMQAVALAQR
jgi:hypothetical protein